MKRHISFLVFFSLTIATVFCQDPEVWSLEQCIRHAIDNNLQVEQSEVNLEFAAVDQEEARQSRWPAVNASAGAGWNFGRVINPATNNFETEDSKFGNLGFSAAAPLFAGNQINNSIKQAKLNLGAAEDDLHQTKQDLALQVALAYLNVLFAQENLVNAQATKELSVSQLEQIDKLIAAGVRPDNERYDLLAQISLDEQNIVQFQNTIEQNMLTLKQLMRLEPSYPMELERPEIEEGYAQRIDDYTFESVYTAALNTQPRISAQQKRIESALLGEKIAKGNYWPSLSIGASIGSNFSDLDQEVTQSVRQRIPFEDVYIDGQPVLFEQEQDIPTDFAVKGFGDQFSNNLGYGVSLSLSVPIYNNYRVKGAIERARLNTILSNNTNEQIKQQLKTDIQNAIASALAARESFEASQHAFDAAEVAYQNAQKRFDLGALNSYDLINAQTRLDSSRINLTISKFDYIFRILVIEYYLGRGLEYE